MAFRFLVFCVVLTAGGFIESASAAPKIAAEISSRRSTIDEPFVWSVVVEDAQNAQVPTIQDTADFSVAYLGPERSVEIVNGSVRQSLRFLFRLTPKREGKLTTPPAAVTVDGADFDIAPLTVEVGAGNAAPAQADETGASVHQEVDKTSVFLGEQLTNTIEIITPHQLIEPQFGDLTYDGFRHVDLGDDQRSTRLVRGRPATVITLKKALYPIRSGELTIPARELRAKMRGAAVRSRRGWPFSLSDPFGSDIFDDFFGGGPLREITLTSEPIVVAVKPLPKTEEKLKTWGSPTVLVGHTGVNIVTATTTIKYGDALTATVDLTSEGNVSLIDSIPFPTSGDYKIYQEQPETNVFDSDGTIVTRKRFKVSVVPLKGGEVTVAPVEISYFDLTSGQYRTTSSKPIVIAVEGAPPSPTPAPEATSDKSHPRSTGEAPRHEGYTPMSLFERLSAYLSAPMLLLLFAILAGVVGIGVGRARTRAARSPRDGAWRGVGGAPTYSALRAELLKAVTLELGETEERTLAELCAEIARRGGASDVEFQFRHLLDDIDAALYGGTGASDIEGLRARAAALRSILPRRQR